MQQWMAKFKHNVPNGKTISKKQEIVLLQAESYADVEQLIAKFVTDEQFVGASSPDIAKHQTHEILGWNPEEQKYWWKARIKCVSEDENQKISIFYVRYLVYADNMEGALKLVKEKEKKAPIPGELEAINVCKIDHMLVPVGQAIHN